MWPVELFLFFQHIKAPIDSTKFEYKHDIECKNNFWFLVFSHHITTTHTISAHELPSLPYGQLEREDSGTMPWTPPGIHAFSPNYHWSCISFGIARSLNANMCKSELFEFHFTRRWKRIMWKKNSRNILISCCSYHTRIDYPLPFTLKNIHAEKSFHIVKIFISYLILYITQWTFSKAKFDLDKMQSFLEVLKMFKFAALLVLHSHQYTLGLEWVVTYIKEHVISGLTHLACFTSVNLTECFIQSAGKEHFVWTTKLNLQR